MPRSRRHHAWQVIELGHGISPAARAFDVVISTLIVLNVAAAVLGTVDSFARRAGTFFVVFEAISLSVFTLEYAVRIWASAEREPGKGPWRSRLRWLFSWGAGIDLLAILPSWLTILGGPGMDARSARALRLMRLFRLLKIGRYGRTMTDLTKAIRDRREELVISMSLTLVMLLVVSTFMYHVEHDAQPDVFSSIPATMWWGVATLTTVGYGDMAPITPLGRFFGGIAALLGIGLFALPAGIVSSAFSDALTRRRRREEPARGSSA